MKFIAIWVENEENLTYIRGRMTADGLNVRVSKPRHLTVDLRFKAPRRQLAKALRIKLNSFMSSAWTVMLAFRGDVYLFKKVQDELDHKSLAQLYVYEARDLEHLIRKYSRRVANNHSLLGV
jgi:hypothetical protein